MDSEGSPKTVLLKFGRRATSGSTVDIYVKHVEEAGSSKRARMLPVSTQKMEKENDVLLT